MIEYDNLLKPHGSERYLIAIILKYPDTIVEISLKVKPDYLNNKAFRKIYGVLWRIYNTFEEVYFDTETIMTFVEKENALKIAFEEAKINREFLESIRELPVDPNNLKPHIDEVIKAYSARKAIDACEELPQKIIEHYKDMNTLQLMNLGEEKFAQLSLGITNTDKIVQAGVGLEEKLLNRKVYTEGFVGDSFLFKPLDIATSGILREGALVLGIAKRKVGKSILSKQLAVQQAIKYKRRTLVAIQEMSKEEYEFRLLSELTGLSVQYIEQGLYLNESNPKRQEETAKISWAINILKESPLSIYKMDSYDFEELQYAARKEKMKHADLRGIIYDYLVEADTSKSSAETSKIMGVFARNIKTKIAEKFKIWTFVLVQGNDNFDPAKSKEMLDPCTTCLVLEKISDPLPNGKENPKFVSYGYEATRLLWVKLNRWCEVDYEIPLRIDDNRCMLIPVNIQPVNNR